MRISDWSCRVLFRSPAASVRMRRCARQRRGRGRGQERFRQISWVVAPWSMFVVVAVIGRRVLRCGVRLHGAVGMVVLDHLRLRIGLRPGLVVIGRRVRRSEEHTSELQSLMRISYAVFFLTKKKSK